MLISEELRQDAKFYKEVFLPYLQKRAEMVVYTMALELDKAILGEGQEDNKEILREGT